MFPGLPYCFEMLTSHGERVDVSLGNSLLNVSLYTEVWIWEQFYPTHVILLTNGHSACLHSRTCKSLAFKSRWLSTLLPPAVTRGRSFSLAFSVCPPGAYVGLALTSLALIISISLNVIFYWRRYRDRQSTGTCFSLIYCSRRISPSWDTLIYTLSALSRDCLQY